MSKTSPVRWWRDDADRYKPRGAYVAPRVESPKWALELLAGPATELPARRHVPMWYRYSGAIPPSADPRADWSWHEGTPFVVEEDRSASDDSV